MSADSHGMLCEESSRMTRVERPVRLFSFSFLVVMAIACGSTGSSSGSPAANTLDCNWLSGPNCFTSTFSPALGCLPDPKATGKLSTDGKTCTYAGGQVITFDGPVTLPLPSNALVSFTLTTGGGTQCLKVNQSSTDSFTLTTSAGTFVWTAGGGAASAVCPDGSSYAASGSSLLQAETCASKIAPGPSLASGSTSVSFGLAGTGAGSSQLLPIFNCQTM
jgi:hypothetical protein